MHRKKAKMRKSKELCTEETEGFTLEILWVEECCQNRKSTGNLHSSETSVKVRTNLSENDAVPFQQTCEVICIIQAWNMEECKGNDEETLRLYKFSCQVLDMQLSWVGDVWELHRRNACQACHKEKRAAMLWGNQTLMLGDKPSCFTGSTKEVAHKKKS